MGNTQGLVARPSIFAIDPYVPGRSKIAGAAKVIKLSSNETPLGPSPHAVEAFRTAAGQLDRYPDGAATALRECIGRAYGLDPARIVCGNGSDELFHYIAQAFIQPGDEAIYTAHGFLVYRIVILANGGTPVVAAETNLTADVDALLERVGPRTRAVFLANPNNPTGTYLSVSEIHRLRAGLPDNVLLVLDGAYAEYVRRNDYDAGIELVSSTPNTVMTRTFSKIHGLASARIGWAYCPPDIADVLNRIRSPFNLSGPGMAAAIASIGDPAHTDMAAGYNETWRAHMTEQLRGLGWNVTESAANFVMVNFSRDPGQTAKDVDAFLLSQGIIVRRLEAYGLPDSLRITIGLENDNRAVIAALTAFMSPDRV